MLWIIIFPFVIDIKCVNEKTTWRAVSDECGSIGLEFEENVLKNIDALLNKEFWIGMAIYRVTTPWIEVLGCFAVPDGHEAKNNVNHISSLLTVYILPHLVFSGNVSGNDNGKCTTLYSSGGKNELTAANCNDENFDTASTCTETSTKEPLHCLAGLFTENYAKRELNITRRDCYDQRFGGVLGASSMVALLAVLIVCKVRSKGIFTESNTHDYEDTIRVNISTTTYEDIDNTKHKSETATSNRTCDIDKSVAPVYEEVYEIDIPGNSISK
ncbi:unnamed protein product [Mytilus coruscus]|uniref:Uncharacterized protein n=1 Tax=Mytilus coruscus TaxID=42192 RepID=A0A6J8ESB1_MYTCO|nr:unnamed protein product [Mytilus coruscus]